ncbi:hypothetical protein DN402_05280 [Streptomyces sp. SW4]|nr:hypothetical protein DN402_05280 [Streptomyces sp. SW4]
MPEHLSAYGCLRGACLPAGRERWVGEGVAGLAMWWSGMTWVGPIAVWELIWQWRPIAVPGADGGCRSGCGR